jgi:hypothetical protein
MGYDSYFIIAMILIICGIGLLTINNTFGPEEEGFSDTRIISLKDTALTHVSFTLGSGVIDQKPSFMYYKVVDNGFQLKSVPASMTTIIEDENDKPFIREYYKIWYTLFTHTKNGYKTLNYEIHIPNGSIIRQFNLDSEV